MFKPMLAPHQSPSTFPEFFKKLRFPLLCSPKIDGIRNTVKEDVSIDVTDLENFNVSPTGKYVCKSRTFETLPSLQVQDWFSSYLNLDGELVDGNETDHNVYNRTQSVVMSKSKFSEGLQFRVFDCADLSIAHEPFIERLEHARKLIKEFNEQYNRPVSLVEHILAENLEELLTIETEFLMLGYEGVMMRDPMGPYKHGRGTFNQGWIYKLKRQEDAECLVIDFVEQMTNENVQERSALGYSKRSSSKDGLVPAGTLGKFIGIYNGMEIEVAPGHFNHLERQYIWDNKELFKNNYLKFRHFPHGVKDKPRHPRAIGWRNKMDM